jgi:chitin disaccharide deacetylase
VELAAGIVQPVGRGPVVRFLIVNADDFGYSDGINAGVIEAHSRGIVTSTSLMVKQPRAPQAADLAARHPRLGVGLHIDLTEWEPVNDVWTQRYSRVDPEDADQVAAEIRSQLELFVALIGHQPDHLDSHQHVHLSGPPRAASLRLASELGVPLRAIDSRVAFCGQFYGQQQQSQPYPEGVTVANVLRLARAMSDGWTELMCHPGYSHDVDSIYAAEREQELAVLCDPAVPQALAELEVRLCSFRDFLRNAPASSRHQ